MKLTVGRVLQLVRDAITAEPDSFGKKAALRRLARLGIASMDHVTVDIPRPEMSEEARGLLENSQEAEPGLSKPEESLVVAKKPRAKRKKRVVEEITHPGPAPGEVEKLLEGSSTTTAIRPHETYTDKSAQTKQEVK